jgi:dipeptidyl aminopeptidase/acylaminoacyl peptidase
MKTTAAYGTWRSSLTGAFVAANSVKMAEPQWLGQSLFWLETRPAEKGRQTILRRSADGVIGEILPNPWNARTKIHEYGGGSFVATPGAIYFVNGEDQQIYRLGLVDQVIEPITQIANCRYGDLHYSPTHHCLLAVCEDHTDTNTEPQNRLISLDLASGQITAVETGHDFVTSAQVSPDGNWLAYITWRHPDMPWQATKMWLRPMESATLFGSPRDLSGDARVSVSQPRWSPGGDLYWISDRTDWWNLYRVPHNLLADGEGAPLLPMAADFAPPHWVCHQANYGFLDDHHLLVSYGQNGIWNVALLSKTNGRWDLSAPLLKDCNAVQTITCSGSHAAVLGGGERLTQGLWLYNNGQFQLTTKQAPLADDDIASARPVSFPTAAGQVAHGFFYPPQNAHLSGPAEQRPPLIVIGHGGPTAAADASLNLKIQFWTQRGFAVFDVNYRGSTGFGRPYREALDRQWGVVDVEDLCAAAEYATAQGWVHPQQRIIRGSSAGGYSVLAALTDRQVFNAGVSLYGIGDLETLARDTHKFEAHYLDSLIGPYPAEQNLYQQRSPLHKATNIRCPLLVFQGMQDKVVPPEQAEQMVAAVKAAKVPVTYVTYAEEGHGFRSAQTIQHQLDAELTFYRTIFNLGADTQLSGPDITIHNWPEVRP